MVTYTIKRDDTRLNQHCEDVEGLIDAIAMANRLLAAKGPEGPVTFTVADSEGYVLYSVTNRRIIGTFHKQQWGGRKGNDAISIGSEEFDATNTVLALAIEQIHNLSDNSEASDVIGQINVDWPGPCIVEVVDSICEYFAVDDVRDVTREALAYAHEQSSPPKMKEEVITVSLQLKLQVRHDKSVMQFIEEMDYNVISKTDGVRVLASELSYKG